MDTRSYTVPARTVQLLLSELHRLRRMAERLAEEPKHTQEQHMLALESAFSADACMQALRELLTIPTYAITQDGPKYTHDCEDCRYLGTYAASGADLYYCPIEPNLLARFSDELSDYSCGLEWGRRSYESEEDSAMAAAYGLALQMGLVK